MHLSRPSLGITRSALPMLAAATLIIDDAQSYAAQRARDRDEEAPVDLEAMASKPVKGGVNPRANPARDYDPGPVSCREDWEAEEPAWKREQRTKHRSASRRR